MKIYHFINDGPNGEIECWVEYDTYEMKKYIEDRFGNPPEHRPYCAKLVEPTDCCSCGLDLWIPGR